MNQDRDSHFVQEGGSIEDCCDDHIPGRPLAVGFAGSSALMALADAIAAAVPAEVVGDLGWAGFNAVVGPHDIIDFGTGFEDTKRIALAQFSFGLSSNTSPADWSRFKECVFRTPEIRTLQDQLERTFGPLQRWASF
ncbi:MAG: hypothetical protein IBJ10_01880 [Phycisphaerales bacterium]|nr:hypothetical protein [Phycisphaerales bacterium]